MKTGPLLSRLAALDPRRFVTQPLRSASAQLDGTTAGATAPSAPHGRRRAADLIRPMQFIGVVPTDIAEEKAR